MTRTVGELWQERSRHGARSAAYQIAQTRNETAGASQDPSRSRRLGYWGPLIFSAI